MKILTVSDKECLALWDYYQPGRLSGYDLILACGDLKAEYLSFLVTMARCPVLYIHGNHDGGYETAPPEGCDDIDGHFVTYNGLRIMGLGGCRRYRPGPHQYTERQMRRHIWKLKRQIKRHKGVDIVVTHAPPLGLGDSDSPTHRGFAALRELIDTYRPQYLVHGHVHMNYGLRNPRQIAYNGTTIVNAYERHVLVLPDRPVDEAQRGQVIYKTHRKEE
ncbi:MAG: metallophosphoesterase [Faecousia sp.]